MIAQSSRERLARTRSAQRANYGGGPESRLRRAEGRSTLTVRSRSTWPAAFDRPDPSDPLAGVPFN